MLRKHIANNVSVDPHFPMSPYYVCKETNDMLTTKLKSSNTKNCWAGRALLIPLCMKRLKTRRISFAATRIHTLQTRTCTHVVKHTQGLVSIFRTSLGIWCLNLEGHFVKQISACWKTIKTCCPCVSISVHVCVGRFISFFWTLRVCAEGGCFNFVIFLYEH